MDRKVDPAEHIIVTDGGDGAIVIFKTVGPTLFVYYGGAGFEPLDRSVIVDLTEGEESDLRVFVGEVNGFLQAFEPLAADDFQWVLFGMDD